MFFASRRNSFHVHESHRERKKQKEREEAWAKLETVAAANAKKLALNPNVVFQPLRIPEPVRCMFGIMRGYFISVDSAPESDDLIGDDMKDDDEEIDVLAKEVVSHLYATFWTLMVVGIRGQESHLRSSLPQKVHPPGG